MLDGRWKATYAELSGSVLTGDVVSAIELQLDADRYTVGNDHGTCSINMDRSPHEMDITGVEGPNAGRTISVPLAWSWRLSNATPEQRQHFEMSGTGQGVYWPDIDEDISAIGMLTGTPAPRLKQKVM